MSVAVATGDDVEGDADCTDASDGMAALMSASDVPASGSGDVGVDAGAVVDSPAEDGASDSMDGTCCDEVVPAVVVDVVDVLDVVTEERGERKTLSFKTAGSGYCSKKLVLRGDTAAVAASDEKSDAEGSVASDRAWTSDNDDDEEDAEARVSDPGAATSNPLGNALRLWVCPAVVRVLAAEAAATAAAATALVGGAVAARCGGECCGGVVNTGMCASA